MWATARLAGVTVDVGVMSQRIRVTGYKGESQYVWATDSEGGISQTSRATENGGGISQRMGVTDYRGESQPSGATGVVGEKPALRGNRRDGR